jgi:hypothetical protein
MLKFILINKSKNCDSCEHIRWITLDADLPQLEQMLRKGGYDQYAYDHTDLVGVEIIEPKPEEG